MMLFSIAAVLVSIPTKGMLVHKILIFLQPLKP